MPELRSMQDVRRARPSSNASDDSGTSDLAAILAGIPRARARLPLEYALYHLDARGVELMPAKSKAQRRFFGYLKGHPAEAKKRGISSETIEKYVHTSDAGLPERVEGPSSHVRKGYRRHD